VSTITCRGISKAFGGTRVLEDLDLKVPDGAVVTVLGESGSGKSTLLRLIAGFERPDAGTISINDQIVDSARRFVAPDRRRTGFVAQEGNLFPHLTAARNIAFGLARRERTSGRVEELLGLVGLGDLAERYPHQLSGGQQQRVALARALAPRPQVVLLDEPFSSLDASLRSSLRFDVMRILRDQRATTVLVTHDQSEALSVADLVGIMDGGRIRQFARPEDLYERPADPTIAQFLGEANIMAGRASHGVVTTAFGELSLANGNSSLAGPAVVLVRPEQIALRRLGDKRSEPGRATGRVVHREYYGHDCVVLVDVDGGEDLVRVRCHGRAPVEVGDAVSISASGDVVAWPADTSGAG
jgi:iron(III) transport system ATP-binding protein